MLQLLFPYDRAFFFARVDGQKIGLHTEEDIERQISTRYATASVITRTPDTSASFAAAGIKVDAGMTAQTMTTYPVWQRLIPLSFIYQLSQSEYHSRVSYRTLSLQQWASGVSEKCFTAARDASIEVKDGKLQVAPSAKGRQCSAKNVEVQLKNTLLSPRLVVDTKPQVIEPRRTDQEVRSQLGKVQKVLDQGVTVQVLGNTVTAEPSEIVGWLQFNEGKNRELLLDVNPGKMQDFIARVQRPVYIAPGVTTVSLRDGQEVSRSAGAAGRGIDAADLVAQLRGQFQSLRSAPITAKVAALPPKEQIQRNYSNSTPGLQALLNDLAKEKGDMAIAVTELDGQGRQLHANGGKQYHPASTYKLFIAYSVVKRVEASQLKWDDAVNGTTVDDCLTKMIVNSDNPCAESFAEKFSWRTIQAELKGLGMTGTDLNRPEPVGTASDQVLFLQKLHRDQLMKPEHKEKLLALMKRQTYRAGIPTGVRGEVADKVGFMGGLLHDSGLVYTSHGVYALSIYSSGGSWGKIADATRQIESLLAS